jgi:two-component system sensor histidine kinase BaeS
LVPQAVAVRPSLERAVSFFAAAAEAGGVRLETRIADEVPDVMADPDRLAQVLGNLVANALRHTPAGGRIECRASADGLTTGSRPRVVTLAVCDTGEGIAADDLPHVFDRFFRGDKSRARGGGGAGLGLAIAKSLVEAMGGAISVESTVGAGTTFRVSLPAAPG